MSSSVEKLVPRLLGIETAGCALVYASGKRHFFSLCGDGSVLNVHLNEKGKSLRKYRSKPFFDPINDPIQEDGVRVGNQWIFVSYNNNVYTIDITDDRPRFPAHWSLLSDSERVEGWQTGGLQLLAAHSLRPLVRHQRLRGCCDHHTARHHQPGHDGDPDGLSLHGFDPARVPLRQAPNRSATRGVQEP